MFGNCEAWVKSISLPQPAHRSVRLINESRSPPRHGQRRREPARPQAPPQQAPQGSCPAAKPLGSSSSAMPCGRSGWAAPPQPGARHGEAAGPPSRAGRLHLTRVVAASVCGCAACGGSRGAPAEAQCCRGLPAPWPRAEQCRGKSARAEVASSRRASQLPSERGALCLLLRRARPRAPAAPRSAPAPTAHRAGITRASRGVVRTEVGGELRATQLQAAAAFRLPAPAAS